MASPVRWGLLLLGATVALADPDFYSAWCPCKLQSTCPNFYGRFFDDVLIFGQVPPCKEYDHVRCCSADNIPEGFDLEQQVQYFPESVEPQKQVVQQAIAERESKLFAVQESQQVRDFKAQQEKLKRDIANGIANPNPPCGCYTEGTCPGRYATKSTGRDIGCLPGFETCCFLDDPWPNYQVTNLTISAPCSIAKACARFFGTSPFDISAFGPLEPCYLGQNRCLDYLEEGSNPQGSRVRPDGPRQPTPQPTYAPAPRPTYAPAPRPTYAPAPRPTYAPAPQPTYAPTRRPTYRPTTTTYRTTTRKLPEPQPDESGSDNIFDIVANGAYLPPSREYGSADERSKNINIEFALPF